MSIGHAGEAVGADDASGIAGTVAFIGLVQSGVVVVGAVDAGERRQHRGLVFVVPAASRSQWFRPRAGFGFHAAIERGLCFWLRFSFASAARRRSTHLPVRYLAVERRHRPLGRDGGRGLFRRAVGDDPVSTGTMANAATAVSAAWVIVPLILIAECFSWHAVLTTNYLGNAIENSIWAVTFLIVAIGICRLLPEFDGVLRAALIVAVIGDRK